MKRSLATLFLLGGLVLTGLPALAADPSSGQPPTVEAQKEALAARSQELERRLRRPTGVRGSRGPRAAEVVRKNRISRQQREIQSLIRRLEAGENVAPAEVDRLLEAH